MRTIDHLEEQFEIWYPAVYRYFRLRGSDIESANDLASVTFERAMQRLDSFDPRKGIFSIWLFNIARNISVNDWKAHAALHPADEMPSEPECEPCPPVDETISGTDERDELLAGVTALMGRERELLAIKFSARFTNHQIAGLTGLSESNVGMILYRALDCLRARMAKAPPGVPCE